MARKPANKSFVAPGMFDVFPEAMRELAALGRGLDGLHGEGLEQAVVGEDAAHLAAALQVGFVLREQAFDFLPL